MVLVGSGWVGGAGEWNWRAVDGRLEKQNKTTKLDKDH